MKIHVKLFLAFAAIYIIWGTTYLAVKIGLESIPPFTMAAIRYCIAGILLLGYCLKKGEAIFTKNAVHNILIGAFIMTFGQATVFWAEKYISSGLAAIFGAFLPICYVITDTRNLQQHKKSKLTLTSIGLGIIGIIILFIKPTTASAQQHIGIMTVVASAVALSSNFCWAAGSLYFNYRIKTGSLYANVGWQLLGGLVCCGLIALVTGEEHQFYFAKITLHAWLAVLYLAIAGSIIALTSLYWLLARRPAPVVGTYAYVNPVIAVILGYIIADEKITALQIIGMLIILAAAYMANQVKFKATETGHN